MKKIQKRKLSLNRETVKELTLRNKVQGGRMPDIEKDFCMPCKMPT
jgi:hypothetical protein